MVDLNYICVNYLAGKSVFFKNIAISKVLRRIKQNKCLVRKNNKENNNNIIEIYQQKV